MALFSETPKSSRLQPRRDEPRGFHSMQDRVEFCVADVERIMVPLKSLCAVAKEQGKTSVDAHRCEVAVVTLDAKPKKLREKAGSRSRLTGCRVIRSSKNQSEI